MCAEELEEEGVCIYPGVQQRDRKERADSKRFHSELQEPQVGFDALATPRMAAPHQPPAAAEVLSW